MTGDPAVVLTVPREVRIQEIQWTPTHLRHQAARHHGSAWEGHADFERDAFSGEHLPQWHRTGLQSVVDLALLAVSVDALPEVAIAIQQANANKRYTQIAGGFQVIPGEDAETTRVDG